MIIIVLENIRLGDSFWLEWISSNFMRKSENYRLISSQPHL